MKIANVHYYNKLQELMLSNIVIESDIYNNYSYTSCVNWDIEKTPETHQKKLEFNIHKPEIGLKKIDFNIIANKDKIDDMNDNKTVHPSDDLANDVHSNIEENKSLYTIASNQLLNYTVTECMIHPKRYCDNRQRSFN